MSFIVLDNVWQTFGKKDKEELREALTARIAQARKNPGAFTDIPPSAPFYRPAVSNIEKMKSYSVILSYGLDRSGYLKVDKEVLKDF
jgi:hypothetical protein